MRFSFLSLLPFSSLEALKDTWIGNALTGSANAQQVVFDYVVVGGGTAGLAVASRLTENPAVTVAVLEAGPNAENLPEVFIPGMIGAGQAFTTLNWAYQTIPQAGLNGRQASVGAGKALGGGTIINSMIFPRAEREQYDAWGKLNGNDTNWTWDALLPYFKKSELFIPPTPRQILDGGLEFDVNFHGISEEGRVVAGYPNFFYPQSEMWRNVSGEFGFVNSPDQGNGRPQGTVGASLNSLDPRNNTRCSSVCAYYTPFSNRPNLKLFTNVMASKIFWQNSTASSKSSIITSTISSIIKGYDGSEADQASRLKAAGVEYQMHQGTTERLYVRKEVVLAAGTIGSPKVLEMSGVGNATILRAAGVEPILELPTVGENLADHVHGWTSVFTNISITKDLLRIDSDFAAAQRMLWDTNRTGLYSAAPRSLGLALPSMLFAASQLQNSLEEVKSNITHYAELFSNGNADLAKGIEWQHQEMLRSWEEGRSAMAEINFEPGYSGPTASSSLPNRTFSSINAVLFGPLSRGRTHISSSDPFARPVVDPAYYAHPFDFEMHVKSIQIGQQMLKSGPFAAYFQGEYEPGSKVTGDTNEERVRNWARGVSTTDNHVIGTLAMMPKEMGGVVDGRLKVRGIDNVRVVDASIVPLPVSAHLVSTVYMIAERAADFIKEDAEYSDGSFNSQEL